MTERRDCFVVPPRNDSNDKGSAIANEARQSHSGHFERGSNELILVTIYPKATAGWN